MAQGSRKDPNFGKYQLGLVFYNSLTRFLVLLLVYVDLALNILNKIIMEYKMTKEPHNQYDYYTFLICLTLLFDLLVRRAYLEKNEPVSFRDALDLVTNSFTLGLSALIIYFDTSIDYRQYVRLANLGIFLRAVRAMATIDSRLIFTRNPFTLVRISDSLSTVIPTSPPSTNGLDISYVTNELLAMSFPYPANDNNSNHKNKIDKVAGFLDKKFANQYKVFNFCSERDYDKELFHNQTENFPIDDYQVPVLRNAVEFLNKSEKSDDKTIKVFHCMGGKGRTGTMVSMYLIHSGICSNAQEAMKFFAVKRTNGDLNSRFKGVETPSQQRFVEYYSRIINEFHGRMPKTRMLKLEKIVLHGIKDMNGNLGSDWVIDVFSDISVLKCTIDSGNKESNSFVFDNDANTLTISPNKCDCLANEIRFEFRSNNKNIPKLHRDCAFLFTLHSSFIDQETNKLRLPREQLDNLQEEDLCEVYAEDFAVEVFFKESASFIETLV